MSDDLSLFARAGRYVEGLVLTVLARDSAQLAPQRFTRAAAKRLRAGIRAIEAYLKRLILLMALEIEPMLPRDKPWVEPGARRASNPLMLGPSTGIAGLPKGDGAGRHAQKAPSSGFDRPRMRASNFRPSKGRNLLDRKPSILTFFTGERPFPDFMSARSERDWTGPKEVQAAPLLQRLSALTKLAKDPHRRAQRLAWTLARRRSGVLLAPEGHVPRHYGVELSALFTAMGAAILARSRERPPPIGPKPRPPPRVRVL